MSLFLVNYVAVQRKQRKKKSYFFNYRWIQTWYSCLSGEPSIRLQVSPHGMSRSWIVIIIIRKSIEVADLGTSTPTCVSELSEHVFHQGLQYLPFYGRPYPTSLWDQQWFEAGKTNAQTYIPQLIVAGSVVDRRSTLSLQTRMAEVGILEEEEEAEMEVDSVK